MTKGWICISKIIRYWRKSLHSILLYVYLLCSISVTYLPRLPSHHVSQLSECIVTMKLLVYDTFLYSSMHRIISYSIFIEEQFPLKVRTLRKYFEHTFKRALGLNIIYAGQNFFLIFKVNFLIMQNLSKVYPRVV